MIVDNLCAASAELFMKRDPRPIWRQVLSGFKIAALIVGCGAAVYILVSFIPIYRIEAWFWHLRHDSVDVGQYRVPVPKHWYVLNNSPDLVLLVDLDSGDTISMDRDIFLRTLSLSAWSNFTLHPPSGIKTRSTGQRTFRISGEKFLCIEQDDDVEVVHLYPIQCHSEGGLDVRFQPAIKVARSHNATFYELLQRIQKL